MLPVAFITKSVLRSGMDLHLKKVFDRRMAFRAGAAFALVGFLFSIWLSIISGRSSIETILYIALICTLLNWLAGSILGGYTTLYDRSKKAAGEKPKAKADVDDVHQFDGHGCP